MTAVRLLSVLTFAGSAVKCVHDGVNFEDPVSNIGRGKNFETSFASKTRYFSLVASFWPKAMVSPGKG